MIFEETLMIAGNEEMPTHDKTDVMIGNNGNGYARISALSVMSKDNYLESLKSDYGTLSPTFDPEIEKLYQKYEKSIIQL